MAYIFVKKSFDSEITGKKRGDETLTFKDNAFATMAAAYNSKNIKWQAVDANGNPVNELVFLDNEITSRVFFPTGNVSVLSSETGKMTGSLPVCPKQSAIWFSGIFAAVTLFASVAQFVFG